MRIKTRKRPDADLYIYFTYFSVCFKICGTLSTLIVHRVAFRNQICGGGLIRELNLIKPSYPQLIFLLIVLVFNICLSSWVEEAQGKLRPFENGVDFENLVADLEDHR